MSNLNLGQTEALTIAQNAFNANYGPNPPAVSIAFTTDSNNNMLVNVSASVTLNTFFLRILSGFKTLRVSSSAQATRNPLVMSLVLDQSYSMTQNGGQQALPPAVNDFIGHFDDTQDYVADITFATLASVPVSMTQPFVSKIESAVNSMPFGSGPDGQRTNSYAGMQDALTQLQSAPISGPNVRKVVVFFTDGWANILQDNLACTKGSSTTTPMLYCGCDPGDYSLNLCAGVFFFTTSGTQTTCPALGFTSTSRYQQRKRHCFLRDIPLTTERVGNALSGDYDRHDQLRQRCRLSHGSTGQQYALSEYCRLLDRLGQCDQQAIPPAGR